jgi:hypothetical protein
MNAAMLSAGFDSAELATRPGDGLIRRGTKAETPPNP